MRKRTSRQRVIWLPPDQTNDIFPDNFASGSTISGVDLNVSGAVSAAVFEAPLVIDTPRDPATESLADLEESSYRLRRIVGKIWILGDRLDEESGVEEVYIAGGIMVRRVDTGGNSLAGIADTAGGTIDNSSPSSGSSACDPWIWENSWFLKNPGFLLDTTSTPTITQPVLIDVEYKMDQKTARVVGPEERLFLHFSAVQLGAPVESQLTNNTTIRWHLRCLGTMKPGTVGNRGNASR